MPNSDSALLHGLPPGSRERYRAMFCNGMAPAQALRYEAMT